MSMTKFVTVQNPALRRRLSFLIRVTKTLARFAGTNQLITGRLHLEKNQGRMASEPRKDAAAKKVEDLYFAFELALSDKRKYPIKEFTAFAEAVRRYVEMTKDDTKIHKGVVKAVNGLREFIQLERKRVPGGIVFQADRLECLSFASYDPSFEGDEPPGL